jgi:hypothetical protein
MPSFDNLDEITELKKAVGSIKENNPELFSDIMENFDENQTIMWMIEL